MSVSFCPVDAAFVIQGIHFVINTDAGRVGGMMMGVWFLSSSFAAYVGGMIAGAMAIGGDGSDVSLVGMAAMDGEPPFPNGRQLGEGRYVEVLAQPHGATSLLHRDLNTLVVKHLDEHNRRCNHICVDGRSAPVQYNAPDRSPVAARSWAFHGSGPNPRRPRRIPVTRSS